jgi:hypothetical protein
LDVGVLIVYLGVELGRLWLFCLHCEIWALVIDLCVVSGLPKVPCSLSHFELLALLTKAINYIAVCLDQYSVSHYGR